jgi:hypothetical protein
VQRTYLPTVFCVFAEQRLEDICALLTLEATLLGSSKLGASRWPKLVCPLSKLAPYSLEVSKQVRNEITIF